MESNRKGTNFKGFIKVGVNLEKHLIDEQGVPEHKHRMKPLRRDISGQETLNRTGQINPLAAEQNPKVYRWRPINDH